MQDKFGRNINYLRLSVTDACNYRCIYCMENDDVNKCRNNEILSIDELINIGRASVDCGINKIRITGGEPLLRSGIIDLCKGLKAIDGLKELAITTNGSRLSEMAAELKASGVDRLNISLDTINEERFKKITRIGSLDEVLKGIDASLSAGFENIKINVVLMAGINDDEIEDLVNITKNKSIAVRFIELMPMGPCKEWYEERFVSTNAVLDSVPDLMPVGRDGVANVYRFENAQGSVGLISPVTHYFCNECNRLRVTADGRLIPCLHSDLGYNVKGISYEEIKNAFYEAINNKPAGHHIVETHRSENSDYMHKIGG